MKISMNIGFVTNSSSCVHHFPGEVLKHPKVQAFLKAFEVADGFIGADLWHRGMCSTVAVTREQKKMVQDQLTNNEYDARGPAINVDSDEVVIIYGDEYQSVAASLAWLMAEVMAEIHGGDAWTYRHKSDEYN